jgi:hypothetical protein
MSRMTQYIGLSTRAHLQIKNAIRTELYVMTQGMFEENVMGKIYHMPIIDERVESSIIKEVVQCEIWSSGPMIFTCLKGIVTFKSGGTMEDNFEECKWTEEEIA